MSFHHDQPCKGDLSNNCEPLAESEHRSHDHHENSSPSTENEDLNMAIVDLDDEEARFELLSAYVDNEVTAQERQLVGQWLRDEPAMQEMYQQLLMLRQAIRTAPVPPPPPLEVPTPPNAWQRALSSGVRWTLVCTTAIALFSGFSQLRSPQGRQNVYEAWQWLKSLPQETLWEFASTVKELPSNNSVP